MAEDVKKDLSERFINSLCLSLQVREGVTKHIQVVITALDDDSLKCYFDVIDPTKLPKFVE